MHENLNEQIETFEEEFYKLVDLISLYTIGLMNI